MTFLLLDGPPTSCLKGKTASPKRSAVLVENSHWGWVQAPTVLWAALGRSGPLWSALGRSGEFGRPLVGVPLRAAPGRSGDFWWFAKFSKDIDLFFFTKDAYLQGSLQKMQVFVIVLFRFSNVFQRSKKDPRQQAHHGGMGCLG